LDKDPNATSPDVAGRSSRRRMLRITTLTGQLGLIVALAVWASEAFDVLAMLHQLRGIPPAILLAAVGLQFCALALQGYRMARLLGTPFSTGFWTFNFGIAMNAVLPFRAGDAARIVVGHTVFGVTVARLSAATVIERLLDLVVALVLFVLTIGHGATRLVPAEHLVGYGALAAVAFAGVGAAVVLRPKGRGLLLKMRSAGRFVIDVTDQIRSYSVWRLVGLTAAVWIANVVVVRVMLDAVVAESQGAFGLLGCITVLVVTALAIALPGTPAALGLFEAAVMVVLVNLYRVTPESALAHAVAYHVVTIAPSIVLLLIFTIRRTRFFRAK
jgi:uncharacterized membrane protein YbhN (UPF0104 family)